MRATETVPEIRKLIVPKVASVVVYDSDGERMDGFAESKIVIEYHQHGAVAHVYSIPPPGHPNEWTAEDYLV